MMTVASLLSQWVSAAACGLLYSYECGFLFGIQSHFFFEVRMSRLFSSLFPSPSSMTTTAVASSKVSSPWIAHSRAAQKAQKRFVGSATTTTSLRHKILVGPKKSRYGHQNAHQNRGRQKRITIRMENFESTPKPDGAPKCTNYYTPELVSKAIAELTAESARTAIEKRGHFAMGLAGGSLIKMLSGLKDEKNNIEWDKWHVFWVDERCVPLDDPESNFGGAYEALFKDVPIPRENLHAIDDSLYTTNKGASEKSAEAYDKELKSLSEAILPRGDGGLPIFDLLLLGFGPDGHICSLFPNHSLVKVNDERWILPIADSPKPPPERITFSMPVVNMAKRKVFAAVGEGKAEMAKHILEDANKTDGSIPAAMVEDAEWLFDQAGSSKLTTTHVNFEFPGTPTLLGLDKKED